MSKKETFHSNQVRQLLRSVFLNVDFIRELPLLTFDTDQMLGCIYIEPADRISLVSSYVDDFEYPEHLSQIDENVTFMMPNSFECNCDENDSFKFTLGYSYVTDQAKNKTVILESFSSVLVIKYIEKTLGFIKFNLELSQNDNTLQLNIHLENIYLLEEYRDKSSWLDLTTALCNFLTVTLEGIVHKANENEKIKVTLLSSINKIGGQIIAELIYHELSYLLECIWSEDNNKKKSLCKINYQVIY